jgi:hypothetical protein
MFLQFFETTELDTYEQQTSYLGLVVREILRTKQVIWGSCQPTHAYGRSRSDEYIRRDLSLELYQDKTRLSLGDCPSASKWSFAELLPY